MYLDYWQLERKPFEASFDADFLYRSEGRLSAMHKLRYAVESGRAAALLAGPAGVGKTCLLASLRRQLPENCQAVAVVNYPLLTPGELLTSLAEQWGAAPAAAPRYTADEGLRRIESFQKENSRQNRRALLIVDEAHLLEDAQLLESLRLLMNLNQDGKPAITLLLSGQMPLLPAIERFGALDERIDVKAVLQPLDAEETAAYVSHRLAAAKANREIFTADALTTTYQLTGGVPRRINRLGDLALLVGFADQRHAIDGELLHAVHEELIVARQIPVEQSF